MISLLLLACTGSNDDGQVPDDDTVDTDTIVGDDDDDVVTTPTGDTLTTPTGSTAMTADTFTLDCTRPAAPIPFATLTGYGTAEDFDFDVNGLHISVQNNNLIGVDQFGQATPLAFSVGNWGVAGTRVLSTGDVLINDSGVGGLTLVDMTTGGHSTVISGMQYPNGLEVDDLDRAYVADQSRSSVIMVDVYANPVQSWIVAEGLNNPNGVILSPDHQTLYVGSFGGGMIYAIDRITDTTWDTPRILHQAGANAGFDGINVDACGTVYFTEWITGRIFRLDPTGKLPPELAVDVPSSWIPNLRWGNGVGGWDEMTLYVADRDQGRLFGMQVGIPGKPHVGLP